MIRKVLISAPYLLPVIEEYRSQLEQAGLELVIADVYERLSEAELLPLVTAIHGAICGDDQFTERVLHAALHLKVISKWGTGIDSIDANAAARLGIRVCNTPNAFTDCVADSTLGYILNFARRLYRMDQDIRSGKWIKSDAVTLRECTLGVVGVGNIGKAVVRRAIAFGMSVVSYDPVAVAESFLAETGLKPVSMYELLKSSDFVTLHCDLNPTSYHLIDRSEFDLMRPSAYLINTSRGSVVNETVLIEALHSGKIAGAALDVFENEPLPRDSPLRQMNNCLLAPHNANSGAAAKRRVYESTIKNLLDGLRDANVHCEAARQTYFDEGCRIDRVLTHGRKQNYVPMPAGGLATQINVGVFLCKDVNELRLKVLVESLLANDRVARVVIRPHPKNLWVHIDLWIAAHDDARLCLSRGRTVLDDIKGVDVVFGGNSSVLIEAVTAGVPGAYVDDLDHGSSDLHGFVAAGLICRSDVNPDFDEMLRFYQRPGWQQTLRTFANIDEDESGVMVETLRTIEELSLTNL